MRSFSSRRASDTNRSGGIHGMSRWQSAEILRYCILFSPLGLSKGTVGKLYSFVPSISWQSGCRAQAFLPMRHERDATRGLPLHANRDIKMYMSTESGRKCV